MNQPAPAATSAQLPPDVAVDAMLEAAGQITAIDRRYLTLDLDGQPLAIPDIATRLEALRHRPRDAWSASDTNLLAVFYALGTARIRLEQVGITADMTAVERCLRVIHQDYRARLLDLGEDPGPPTEPLPWWEVAAALPPLRERIDRHFLRLLEINGANWHRRERLLPRTALADHALPQALLHALERHLPEVKADQFDTTHAYLTAIGLAAASADGGPVALLELVMRHAAEDPRHPSDHATLMCPRGTNLDHPGALAKSDFAIYVAFHRDFIPPKDAGVGDYQAIRKAMYAHHAAKKARIVNKTYDASGRHRPAGLADDLGARGIFFNEHAHHRGHVVAGVTTALRSLMDLTVTRAEGTHTIKGLTDWRLARADTSRAAHYDIDQYPSFYHYGQWIRTLVEAMLSTGIILPAMIGAWR